MNLHELPTTAKEARRRGLNRYYTGKPCKHGHVCERLMDRRCIQCSRLATKKWGEGKQEYYRVWAANKRAKDPVAARNAWRKAKLSRYGLTPEEYEILWEGQNGCCKCCGDPMIDGKFAHIDHCHRSGVVRAILCYACNIAVGLMKEDPERSRKLTLYIEEWSKTNEV